MSTTLITITGNLTDDAEVRTTTGKATARLRVAVNRRRRDAAGTWTEQTDFHTVVVWGTLAEAAADLRKGSAVIVHGRLAQRDWTTTAGDKRTVWEICECVAQRFRPGPLPGSGPVNFCVAPGRSGRRLGGVPFAVTRPQSDAGTGLAHQLA
jgi:single-strand DNA-binding protein